MRYLVELVAVVVWCGVLVVWVQSYVELVELVFLYGRDRRLW